MTRRTPARRRPVRRPLRRRFAPVHPKVKAATAGASAGVVVTAFVLWVIAAVFTGGNVDAIPTQVVGLVFLAVPAACSFAAGWLKNTLPRS